jgi:hypothetical protein
MAPALIDFVSECQWVGWRNEERGGKPTKVPYVAAGRQAEADDPTTWLTHDCAAVVAEDIVNGMGGGVGIELGRCGNVWLAGVDLDACRAPATGEVADWAASILDRLDTYAEVSPSGGGIKAFLLIDPAAVEALRRCMGTQHGRQFRQAGGGAHGPAIELYISNHYFAVTWQTLDTATAELRQVPLEDLRWLVEDVGPAFSGKPTPGVATRAPATDETILDRLNRAAAHSRPIGTALRNAATLHGGSRSEGPFGLGCALRRSGWSFADMKAALLACPATREWAAETLAAEGDRQFTRIWQKEMEAGAGSPSGDNQEAEARGSSERSDTWPQPLDIFFTASDTDPPELTPEHVPAALWPFVHDTSERMGVDHTSVALSALVSCASVISEDWRLQPKRYDTTWTENARLWGAIIGDPSVAKSPIIAACTRPIDRLEAKARKEYEEAMRGYEEAIQDWEDGDKQTPKPPRPKLARHLVEGFTVEALSEVLRSDDEARQYAPVRKVLIRQDELAEALANLDRYRAGGRGGGDRGAYLRLYNGGRYTIDRIGRGTFAIPNWSACFLGGIQPEPIQRIANEAADDGLLQRFIYSVPGRQNPGIDRSPDRVAIQRYEALFARLGMLHPPSAAVDHDAAPVALHRDAHVFREEIDLLARTVATMPDTSSRVRSALGKWPGLFTRLCLTFHLIDLADASSRDPTRPFVDAVPEATACRVANFMRDIILPNLLRADAVMFNTPQAGHARWIAGHILAHGLDRITSRDIARAYSALRSPEAKDGLASVMASLVTVGWLEPEPPTNAFKPVSAWAVNPAVHLAFEARAAREREEREQTRERINAYVQGRRRTEDA